MWCDIFLYSYHIKYVLMAKFMKSPIINKMVLLRWKLLLWYSSCLSLHKHALYPYVTAKLLYQNGLGQFHISLWKSCLYVRPGRGDTKWYHYNPDGHKDRTSTEKYGVVLVHFGKVVLLCMFLSFIWVQSSSVAYKL